MSFSYGNKGKKLNKEEAIEICFKYWKIIVIQSEIDSYKFKETLNNKLPKHASPINHEKEVFELYVKNLIEQCKKDNFSHAKIISETAKHLFDDKNKTKSKFWIVRVIIEILSYFL